MAQARQDGTWMMSVGAREQSIRVLESAMAASGGSLRETFDRMRINESYLTAAARTLTLLNKGVRPILAEEPEEYENVREELGAKFFVSPHQVTNHLGLPYTTKSLERFKKSLPSPETLLKFNEQGVALVAGPPDPLNCNEIAELIKSRGARNWQEGRAYVNPYIGFAIHRNDERDLAPTSWIAIKTEIEQGSVSQPYDALPAFLAGDERVPDAGELFWFTLMLWELHGSQLFVGHDLYTTMRMHGKEGHSIVVRSIVESREPPLRDWMKIEQIRVDEGMSYLDINAREYWDESRRSDRKVQYKRQCVAAAKIL